MTKLAKDLKPGDVLVNHRIPGKVVRVHAWHGKVDVLLEGGPWLSFSFDTKIEIKPSTIKASEVKSRMVISLSGRPVRVRYVGTTDSGRKLIAGYVKGSGGGDCTYACVSQNFTFEVIE